MGASAAFEPGDSGESKRRIGDPDDWSDPEAAAQALLAVIRDPMRVASVLAAHTQVLELMARHTSLSETLTTLSLLVEGLVEDGVCTVMIADHERGLLFNAAAPSLPAEVIEYLAAGMEIAEGSAACGTAAFRGETVVVDDTSSHPYLDACRQLALTHGLLAVWSTPIFGCEVRPLGTFAMYYHERRAPTPAELAILSTFGALAGTAIQQERDQDRLAHRALHDRLTGLPNRVLVLDRISHAVEQLERLNTMVAVLVCTIDRFKLINDSLGHEQGDRVLVAIADRLQSLMRPGDTTARFGGDEFVVLCEQIESQHDLLEIATRVRDVLHEPFVIAGSEVFLTCSIGVAVAESSDATAEALLRDADAAMYRAKTTGHGQFELFDAEMRRNAVRRLEIENALRRAITRDEIEVHYQPIVSLRTETIFGVEALARWQHPQRGLLPPDDFIGIAEETGLIIKIGETVLQSACRQLRRWQAHFTQQPALTMWVNLSTRQLANPGLVETVQATLAETGIQPSSLCLEVTETVTMDDTGASADVLAALERLGICIAIDDFGTGYSSLNYLKRLHANYIKIDQSFVEGLGVNSEDTAIVHAIHGLAKALGLGVVVEGVERAEQVELLRDLDSDLAQGWAFWPAQPADGITRMLAERTLPADRRYPRTRR
jgi:diguanylate cyclase (GGDEF)-like protein